ncbi:MAG: NAD-dependent dehydratase [Planctomycetota bacterium]|nr:MAG: NAD-dependent dehydratase [Planctomycetota bacterium]
MNALITGGAGFIGRWVTAALIEEGHSVTVLDDLSNGSAENIAGLECDFVRGDIRDERLLDGLFRKRFDGVMHLAAGIIVQDSIDSPARTFEVDVRGTFNVLERCRAANIPFLFVSTCMVYDRAFDDSGIDESHPVRPASPYAAAKLAGEHLALSYYHAYGLPAAVVRPFNTYGPCQKSNSEGGVVSIFIERDLRGERLDIYGDGAQTRDLMYVEDCARFIVAAARSPRAVGRITNAGTGRDVSINELASMVCPDEGRIRHVPHIHPQSEIPRLLCNPGLARELLGWSPRVTLEEGLRRTRAWLRERTRCASTS